MYIVCSTDDFRPSLIEIWKSYWDVIKEKHPNLQVTVYVPAYYQEFGTVEEEDISKSSEFRKWYEKRKSYISIIPHGYDHTKPFENQRSYEEQKQIIQKSLEVLKDYIDKSCLGWKAPFYKMNKNTIRVLKEFGFSWYSQWWYLCPLRVLKKPMPRFVELPSHTSSKEQNNPDAINIIYEKLDRHLTELENQGCEYSNLNEIVRKVT